MNRNGRGGREHYFFGGRFKVTEETFIGALIGGHDSKSCPNEKYWIQHMENSSSDVNVGVVEVGYLDSWKNVLLLVQ